MYNVHTERRNGVISMRASPTVLCNNILLRGVNDRVKITPMKLQKLMYFVCRDYTKRFQISPISEQFEVWQYGPVLPSVYSEFKAFGANPITEFARDALGSAFMVSEKDNPELADVIDAVWEKYRSKTGIELSKVTHQPQSGWYRAYSQHRQYITEEDMKVDSAG